MAWCAELPWLVSNDPPLGSMLSKSYHLVLVRLGAVDDVAERGNHVDVYAAAITQLVPVFSYTVLE